MAMFVANSIALAMPCKARTNNSISTDCTKWITTEEKVNNAVPPKKMRRLPTMLDSRPMGNTKIVQVIKNISTIQLMADVPALNSLPISGKDMLSALPVKGVKKEATITVSSTVFSFDRCKYPLPFRIDLSYRLYKNFINLAYIFYCQPNQVVAMACDKYGTLDFNTFLVLIVLYLIVPYPCQ